MQLQRIGVFGAFLFVLAAGCRPAESEQGGAGGPSATTPSTPTESERIALRSAERWKKVAAANWIEAYDYLPPDERKTLAIVDYLQGKSKHRYESPDVPEVLEVKGDVAYVAVASMWTPTHPALATVKLGPGESLTQRLEMIETWKRVEGEWYFAENATVREFFVAHPEVPRPTAKAPSNSDAATRVPPSGGG
jgi:hypothetical protein